MYYLCIVKCSPCSWPNLVAEKVGVRCKGRQGHSTIGIFGKRGWVVFLDADEVIALFFSIPGQMTDEVHRPPPLHLGGLGAAYHESGVASNFASKKWGWFSNPAFTTRDFRGEGRYYQVITPHMWQCCSWPITVRWDACPSSSRPRGTSMEVARFWCANAPWVTWLENGWIWWVKFLFRLLRSISGGNPRK